MENSILKQINRRGFFKALLILLPFIPGCMCSEAEPEGISLELTYPAGKSPKVFTSGWVFGARCIANPGTSKERDLSDQVKWSGSGKFEPDTGKISRPKFDGPGNNFITLSIEVEGQTKTQRFRVVAVDPSTYARVGSKAECMADSHGCPACPHHVIGPVTSGSPNVLIEGVPAARVGDPGVHAACCGPNTFKIVDGGDNEVIINGKPAAKLGSKTQHCGGVGEIVSVI